jgi:DNA-binding transcriptional MerR regulator
MDITELVKKTGIAASKLRYYEEVGLIKSTGRNGIKRVFSADIVQTLSLITLAKSGGFSLKEISSMLPEKGQFKINRVQLREKAEQIDVKIKKLKKMRDGLRHASNCPQENHFECTNFQKLIKSAIKKSK